MSFDDAPEAPYYRPALTTVRLDFAAAGRAALRRLLQVLDEDPTGALEPPAPSLVLRESSGPPPG